MKNSVLAAIAALLLGMLGGCASVNTTGYTMRGAPPEDTPPALATSVTVEEPPPPPVEAPPPPPAKNVADGVSTYHYMVNIYPGVGDKFDPNPTLTLDEFNQLGQLDWYCARQVENLKGQAREMTKQAGLYGALQGILGAAGYALGFGSIIEPERYLAAIGLTAAGGGLASGKITFDTTLNVAHGYCMTGMVYKADELEGKLKRIFIVPIYTGQAKLPEVSDKPAPTFTREGGDSAPPPPRF